MSRLFAGLWAGGVPAWPEQDFGLSTISRVERASLIFVAASALSLAAFCYAPGVAHAEAMLLPGKFDVSANGAAAYSVQIAVPPGTAGMVPALSLDYSSQSGSGLVGVGWSLSGLPAIGRCPRTMVQDSVRGSVNYDLNDRFCMEGQRLVLISGTYGAAGSEYRTEIEGFSKITASGAAGNGPASFTVKTKSGQIMEFGITTDSRILAQGKTTARSWAVNKISDTKGNYLTVAYTNDTVNGQAYPTRIDYTGNAAAGLTPYNSVQFAYETRPDIVPMYHAGSLQKTTVRLTDVKTYEGANLVSDYKLSYDLSPATSRSRLTAIKLCSDAAAITCLPPTTLAYSATTYASGGANGLVATSNTFGQDGNLKGYYPILEDFNGDGRTDVLWIGASCWADCGYLTTYPEAKRVLWLSNISGVPTVITNVAGQDGLFPWYAIDQVDLSEKTNKINQPTTVDVHYGFVAGDFNGDGKADILWYRYRDAHAASTLGTGPVIDQPTSTWLSNGDGTFQVLTTAVAPPVMDSPTTVSNTPMAYRYAVSGDWNGDGKTDLLWISSDNGSVTQNRMMGQGFFKKSGRSLGRVIPWLSNGDGTFQAFGDANLSSGASASKTGPLMSGSPASIDAIADFNGDGKSDLYWSRGLGTDSYYRMLWLSDGDGAFTAKTNLQGADGWYLGNSSVADFNGDGKADFLWNDVSNNTRRWWLSTGDGTFSEENGVATGQLAGYSPLAADFDADGKGDVLWINYNSNVATLWLSKGNGTYASFSNPFGLNGTYDVKRVPYFWDWNGDGKLDVLWNRDLPWDSKNFTSIKYNLHVDARALWLSDGIPSDVLSSFTTGLGVTTYVDYGPLTNPYIYTKGTGAVYPEVDIVGASYVVYRVRAGDGVGGTYVSNYSYGGGKVDLNGRGFLGFRGRVIHDQQTNIVQTTTYRQDFPYVGLASAETKYLNNDLLNYVVNSYAATPLGGTRNFVSLTGSVASSWDLDRTVIPPVTTSYQYDAYGNATQVTVSTPDGASKTTTNTYANDTVNWFLGRLTAASVTSTVP